MELLSPEAVVAWLRDLGPLAIPACLVIMTVSAVVPIPAELPAMLNGAVLGLWTGSVVTWIGAMLGTWLSYEGAARLQAGVGLRWLGADRSARLARLGRSTGATELLLLRLAPVVAFHLINYAAGAAGVPRRRFFLTTALGILPGAFAFTAGGMVVERWLGSPWVRWGLMILLVGVLGWRLVRWRKATVAAR